MDANYRKISTGTTTDGHAGVGELKLLDGSGSTFIAPAIGSAFTDLESLRSTGESLEDALKNYQLLFLKYLLKDYFYD